MTQEAKITPGPWFVNEGRMTVEAHDQTYGNGIVIAKPNTQADARLIASAPELLESLEEVLGQFSPATISQEPSLKKARTAIAKARGQS